MPRGGGLRSEDGGQRATGPGPDGPSPGSASPPFVVVQGVSRRFGEVVAVDDVSLEISKGEIFCLLGGSGSGKTTLLRILAGFERPSSGRILVDGRDLTPLPPHRRPVNMMFQSYALFPHMDVGRNVAFGLEQEGLARREIDDRVREMLTMVELADLGHRRPDQLSGGQRQRVALARALVKRPRLLLLDEPLAALDRKLRERTQFELLRLQERLGVTCLVVTHDQEEAMTLASRIGVMHRGRIAQVGTPAELYERPRSLFVADFIGSMNLFEGHVVERRAGFVRIESRDLGLVSCSDPPDEAVPGSRVWVALRPERIGMHRERGESEANTRPAVVREVAYRGGLSLFHLQLESGALVRVTAPNRAAGEGSRFSRNDAVWIRWDAAAPVVLSG